MAPAAPPHPRSSEANTMSHLLQLPIELLGTIAGLVDLDADLPSLALACRALFRICFPRWEFEAIRLRHPHAPGLWDHLARHPADALRVQDVRIGVRDEFGHTEKLRVPHAVVPAPSPADASRTSATGLPELGGEQANARLKEKRAKTRAQMCAVLQNMRHLRRFVWRIEHDDGLADFDAIWAVLAASCGHLELLDVSDLPTFAVGNNLPLHDSALFNVRNLTELSLTGLDHGPHTAFPPLDRLAACLRRSPRLVRLELFWRSPVAPALDDLLAETWLPCLADVCIGEVTVGAPAMAAFCGRHPLLHTLRLWGPVAHAGIDYSRLEAGMLPRLRTWAAYCPAGLQGLVHLERARAPLEEIAEFGMAVFFETLDAQTRRDVGEALKKLGASTLREVAVSVRQQRRKDYISRLRDVLGPVRMVRPYSLTAFHWRSMSA